MTDSTITIETLEHLAAEIELEDAAERNRLRRLITAYARIVAAREPGKFKAGATEYADEEGHSDNSFPPEQEYRDRRGPRLLEVEKFDWDYIATSGGFYHDARVATRDCGLYVSPKGGLYGGTMTGTGRFGSFAAYPGYCDVQCAIEWDFIDLDDVPLERLRAAEEKLRTLAFPLIAKRLAAATPA